MSHPNIESSIINKRWIEELKKEPERFTIHDINTLYPDNKIDVFNEQALVEAHENLVLQFPFFWFNCPPLMKKWLDDVLTHGWAFGSQSGGVFMDKKVALAVSAGIEQKDYSEEGRYHYTLEQLLRPFETTFRYMGANYCSHFAFFGAEYEPSLEVIEQSAQEYKKFLTQI